jgi:hypothetical protein
LSFPTTVEYFTVQSKISQAAAKKVAPRDGSARAATQ